MSNVAASSQAASKQSVDVSIIGAGIAGLVTALEYLRSTPTLNTQVLITDLQPRHEAGGLARYAFGGMALNQTPEQQRMGVDDPPQRLLNDWLSFAEFTGTDVHQADYWPYQWAKLYAERAKVDVYDFVRDLNIRFLPAVNWVERGLYQPGNSAARYHVMWGTSLRLVEQVLAALAPFEGKRLSYQFLTRVSALLDHEGDVIGHQQHPLDAPQAISEVYAKQTVIASGGVAGNVERVTACLVDVPPVMLNGAHPSADGHLHDQAQALGASITRLGDMWNYAAGIAHPKPHFDEHGLSLIPCKSALWLDASGKRIGPMPLVTGFDTHDLCQQMAKQPEGYAWHLLNWRIAKKELAISGAEHNVNIRDRNWFGFIKDMLLGNTALLNQLVDESPDFLVADDLSTLVTKMNQLTELPLVKYAHVAAVVSHWDEQTRQHQRFWNDEQIRRIQHARAWKADRLRTCKPAPLLEPSSGPLIAIRVKYITRKNLGGIRTNLDSQVLAESRPISNLYAVGEAAGFGGGGASGKRSLEGTFLSGCILTARQAARCIARQSQ